MKMELVATTEEESSSPNNSNQFTSREKMEKLLGICLSRQKLLLIERNIGADFNQLKQTLVGCFVRVPVQGRPMLAIIRSVRGSCQIEWARFGRRLRLSELGYFEFDEVDPKMPGQDEMERWCQRSEQKGRAPVSAEFIEEKRAQLNKFIIGAETKVEPQSAEEDDVSRIWEGTSARDDKENIGNGAPEDDENEEHIGETVSFACSDQSEDEEYGEEEEDNFSIKTEEEWPELPNVEGLVQSRELLAQVLLSCGDFKKFFSARANTKAVSLATAGCLMAFRIAGKEQVIVDEITGVKGGKRKRRVYFKLDNVVVNISRLLAVKKSQVTDRVFDQWLQRLAIRNESVPAVQTKYERKMDALAQMQIEFDKNEQKKRTRKLARSVGAEWARRIVGSGADNLPDISPVIVTAEQVQLLADHLGLAELRRVLTGCFVAVTLWKFVLELKNLPKIHRRFVVPIERVVLEDAADSSVLLLFNRKIPIRHQKTGKRRKAIRLPNVSEKKFSGSDKLVVQSLLVLKELEIPLPNAEEIARKSTELNSALAKVSSFSSAHSSTSSISDEKLQHQPFPGSSGATSSVLHHSPTNQPGKIKHQRQRRKRRIGTENEDAGEKRQRSDI